MIYNADDVLYRRKRSPLRTRTLARPMTFLTALETAITLRAATFRAASAPASSSSSSSIERRASRAILLLLLLLLRVGTVRCPVTTLSTSEASTATTVRVVRRSSIPTARAAASTLTVLIVPFKKSAPQSRTLATTSPKRSTLVRPSLGRSLEYRL